MEKTNKEWRDILMGWMRKAEALATIEPSVRYKGTLYQSDTYTNVSFSIQEVKFDLDHETKGTEEVFNAVNATLKAIAISCKVKLENKRAEFMDRIAALDEAALIINENENEG